MKRKPKMYELFEGWNGPTVKSEVYGGSNKTIYRVAAYSVKQAVFLAAHRKWFDGWVGLYELYDGNTWDFFYPEGVTYRHGQGIQHRIETMDRKLPLATRIQLALKEVSDAQSEA